MQEWLLTDEEMGKVKFDMGSPWGIVDRYTVGKAIAQAQLAKAEPLIRKDERERIHNAIIEAGSIHDMKGSKQRMLVILLSQFYKALKGEGKG